MSLNKSIKLELLKTSIEITKEAYRGGYDKIYP